MNSEQIMRNLDREGNKEIVTNVEVTNHWIRHAQKQSGDVCNASGDGISTSAISEKGASEATKLGQEIIAPGSTAKVVKRYASDQIRTVETLDNITEGYKDIKPETEIKEAIRVKKELSSNPPSEYDKVYLKMWNENKKKIMEEKGLKFENFSKLSPDEQEKIAEAAEEPVIAEWLDNPDGELAKLHPPKDAASDFAVLFDRRHDRLVSKLKDDSKLDIMHNTHKTITEPFLMSGVLVDKQTGKNITKLEEIGGSLQILDNWTSKIKTDEKGEAETTVQFRDKEYTIDNEVLEELVERGLERSKE